MNSLCSCNDFAVIAGLCTKCYYEVLDQNPQEKSEIQVQCEEIEATIRLEVGDRKDYPNLHRYLMRLFEVCGKRIGSGRYKKKLEQRYLEEKAKAESLDNVDEVPI